MVHGPSLLQMLEGTLEIRAPDQVRIARAGELAVFPEEWPRELIAREEAMFPLVLSLDDAPV